MKRTELLKKSYDYTTHNDDHLSETPFSKFIFYFLVLRGAVTQLAGAFACIARAKLSNDCGTIRTRRDVYGAVLRTGIYLLQLQLYVAEPSQT